MTTMTTTPLIVLSGRKRDEHRTCLRVLAIASISLSNRRRRRRSATGSSPRRLCISTTIRRTASSTLPSARLLPDPSQHSSLLVRLASTPRGTPNPGWRRRVCAFPHPYGLRRRDAEDDDEHEKPKTMVTVDPPARLKTRTRPTSQPVYLADPHDAYARIGTSLPLSSLSVFIFVSFFAFTSIAVPFPSHIPLLLLKTSSDQIFRHVFISERRHGWKIVKVP